MKVRFLVPVLVLALLRPSFADQPPEFYATLPIVDLVTLSPSGNRVALRQTDAKSDTLAVLDIDANRWLSGFDVSDIEPRRLFFLNDKQLIVEAEIGVISLDIDSGETRHFRADTFAKTALLAQVSGKTKDSSGIFVPGYIWTTVVSTNPGLLRPRYSLLVVSPEQSSSRIVEKGGYSTIDWFVDSNGKLLIREDYSDGSKEHRLWALDGAQDRLLYEQSTELQKITPLGLVPDASSLVVYMHGSDENASLYSLRISDGKMEGPIFESQKNPVSRVITDINRTVYGVEYAGQKPAYRFFDAALSKRIADIQASMPSATVRLRSFSDDFEQLLMHVSEGWNSGVTLFFGDDAEKPGLIGTNLATVDQSDFATAVTLRYPTRDGSEVPALLTGRKSVLSRGAAPLIVLPQSTLEYHGRYSMHWIAQFFASRNYLVLQPLFRGASRQGSGDQVSNPGVSGGNRYTDIDDAVHFLVDQNIVEDARVCVVGTDYGGYVAMAAGTFSGELYRCVVSINGISDLTEMLDHVMDGNTRDHRLIRYWRRVLESDLPDDKSREAMSPLRHADKVSVPLLLLHGKDDSLVPIQQSRRMYKALKQAGKDVEFVKLKRKYHWLSKPSGRLEALEAMAVFIEQHLPAQGP